MTADDKRQEVPSSGSGEILQAFPALPFFPAGAAFFGKAAVLSLSLCQMAGISAPPFTGRWAPVMKLARSLARKSTAFAISWSVPRRPRGTPAS